MTSYAKKERARYWPVSAELMAQYKDGSHSNRNSYGTLQWYQNGQRHRDDDKPAFISADGSLGWCQNGEYHRDGDKPAWIGSDGRLNWYQNGECHRFRGPARIYSDGTLTWWIHGEEITQEVNEWLAGEEWYGTPEQIFEFQLRFL